MTSFPDLIATSDKFDDSLGCVSTLESNLVKDDTKSLRFGKTLIAVYILTPLYDEDFKQGI